MARKILGKPQKPLIQLLTERKRKKAGSILTTLSSASSSLWTLRGALESHWQWKIHLKNHFSTLKSDWSDLSHRHWNELFYCACKTEVLYLFVGYTNCFSIFYLLNNMFNFLVLVSRRQISTLLDNKDLFCSILFCSVLFYSNRQQT